MSHPSPALASGPEWTVWELPPHPAPLHVNASLQSSPLSPASSSPSEL